MNADKIEAYNKAFALKAETDEAARAAAVDFIDWADAEIKKAIVLRDMCATTSQQAAQAAATIRQTMAVQKEQTPPEADKWGKRPDDAPAISPPGDDISKELKAFLTKPKEQVPA